MASAYAARRTRTSAWPLCGCRPGEQDGAEAALRAAAAAALRRAELDDGGEARPAQKLQATVAQEGPPSAARAQVAQKKIACWIGEKGGRRG